jgi:hypothetical protein
MGKEVNTSIGVFELVKPKAGVRNRALAAAETDAGQIKRATMMIDLLPRCVDKRPAGIDQDTPIEHVLDSLEIEDYDKLVEALGNLIGEVEPEEKKTQS